jgi:DNA-binding transcriptional regulator LsrR (DeoR family)
MKATKPSPALTFEQKVIAAYLHYVRGVTQDDIASAFAVNIGRVNEAVLAIKAASK